MLKLKKFQSEGEKHALNVCSHYFTKMLNVQFLIISHGVSITDTNQCKRGVFFLQEGKRS